MHTEQHNAHRTTHYTQNNTMHTEQHNAHRTTQCTQNNTVHTEQHNTHRTTQHTQNNTMHIEQRNAHRTTQYTQNNTNNVTFYKGSRFSQPLMEIFRNTGTSLFCVLLEPHRGAVPHSSVVFRTERSSRGCKYRRMYNMYR